MGSPPWQSAQPTWTVEWTLSFHSAAMSCCLAFTAVWHSKQEFCVPSPGWRIGVGAGIGFGRLAGTTGSLSTGSGVRLPLGLAAGLPTGTAVAVGAGEAVGSGLTTADGLADSWPAAV